MFLLGNRVNITRHSVVNFLDVPRASWPVIIAKIKIKPGRIMIEREKDRERGGREEKEEIIAPAKLKIALSSFPRCK